MINAHISIRNPWTNNYFNSFKEWSGLFSKYKAWEVQLYYTADVLVEANLKIETTGHDHAGASIDFILLGFAVTAQIYDTRHWDYDNNCWEDPAKFTENAG